MRIGIDLDDTISCTKEEINYLMNEYLVKNRLREEDLTEDLIRDFYKKSLPIVFKAQLVKENAPFYINELIKDNEIYIITARNNNFVDDSINVEKLTNEWLDKNNIKYTKIIFDSYHDGKRQACIDNKIELFIDNDIVNIEYVKSSGIRTIVFDDNGRYTGIECITNWDDLYNYIKSL